MVVVIGAGIAGSLLALALARRGLRVRLVSQADPPGPTTASTASLLSYGSMLGQGAARPWQRLERRHGPLGWRPSALVQHSWPGLIAALPPPLQDGLTTWLPVSRVDGRLLQAGLGAALQAADVQQCQARVERLESVGLRDWRVRLRPAAVEGVDRDLAGEEELRSATVVLAAGSGCRRLWPALPGRLRSSWAGVLVLPRIPAGNRWLEQGRRGESSAPGHRARGEWT